MSSFFLHVIVFLMLSDMILSYVHGYGLSMGGYVGTLLFEEAFFQQRGRMDRAICHSSSLLTFRELLAVLREVLYEIEFRIDAGASLAISSSPEPSDYGEETESEISDSDL